MNINGFEVMHNLYMGIEGIPQKINPIVKDGNLYIPMLLPSTSTQPIRAVYMEIEGELIKQLTK